MNKSLRAESVGSSHSESAPFSCDDVVFSRQHRKDVERSFSHVVIPPHRPIGIHKRRATAFIIRRVTLASERVSAAERASVSNEKWSCQYPSSLHEKRPLRASMSDPRSLSSLRTLQNLPRTLSTEMQCGGAGNSEALSAHISTSTHAWGEGHIFLPENNILYREADNTRQKYAERSRASRPGRTTGPAAAEGCRNDGEAPLAAATWPEARRIPLRPKPSARAIITKQACSQSKPVVSRMAATLSPFV